MDMSSIIAGLPLFQGLKSNQCAALAGIAQRRYYSRGQVFFSEGDDADGFYVILAGKVKIFKLSPDGKEQIFHILEAPEPFGEAAVFSGTNFPASATALVETPVLFFPTTKFVDLIRQDPVLALSMLGLLSLRLRKLTTLVENLSLKEVPGRLAAYLLYQIRDNGTNPVIELSVSKNQMAGLLGTIPETLSRILRRMAEENIIRTDIRTITILDQKQLADLAEGIRKLS
ncbi:MAG TPA: Crp/Fnr family transcriptional regulator [Smithellaceae bacterium]|jgi:CRP/FNR family transcriptional regulator|nr:Crp/Fnr family transcriptional regulator [Syntrophaceae bacterium]HPL96355.1 Crp/Fnr family transcriptional regulator [Smithellaceae bacterium]HPV50024.1 Crp/Fnr family transcriptional regulator [Smithellaceae bacterium]